MYQKQLLFTYENECDGEIISGFKSLCCFGGRQDFEGFIKDVGVRRLSRLKNTVYIDEVVHGGILAIHHDNTIALDFICENFHEFFKSEIRTFLTAAANHHKIKIVQYLLDKGADPSELKGSSSYSNYDDIRELFDKHLASSSYNASYNAARTNQPTQRMIMIMTDINMQFDTLNLAGIELKGDTPITPRTMTFLKSKGGEVTQKDGFITFMGGNFSFLRDEIENFLKEKQEDNKQVVPKAGIKPTA